MDLQDKNNQINRLNDCVEEYKLKSKDLNDLLFQIYRTRNEIKVLCKNLEIDLPDLEGDEDEEESGNEIK
jgi:hypothetical protein